MPHTSTEQQARQMGPSSFQNVGVELEKQSMVLRVALKYTTILRASLSRLKTDHLSLAGLGLFAKGALINHSCTPNAVQVFLGRSIHFRALRNLEAGEEVTIAYIEVDC